MLFYKLSFITLFFLFSTTFLIEGRRRISQSNKAFEDKQAPFSFLTENENEKKVEENEKNVEKKASTTNSPIKSTTEKIIEKEEELIENLLNGIFNIQNLTKLIEEEFEEGKNATVLWIDTHFKALDYNLTVDDIDECILWQKYWNKTSKNETSLNSNETEEINLETLKSDLKNTEIIKNDKRLKKIGLNPELLEIYSGIGLVYREICGNHGRTLWYRSREDAKRIGVDAASPICEPFKEELNPDEKTLSKLALKLNILIQNVTDGIKPALKRTANISYSDFESTTPKIIQHKSTKIAEKIEKILPISEMTDNEKAEESNSENFASTKITEIENEINLNNFDDEKEEKNIEKVGKAEAEAETKEEEEEDEFSTSTTPTLSPEESSEIQLYDDDIWDYRDMEKRLKIKNDENNLDSNLFSENPSMNHPHHHHKHHHHHRHRRSHKKGVIITTKIKKNRRKREISEEKKRKSVDSSEDDNEDDWLDVKQIIKTEDGETTIAIIEEQNHLLNGNLSDVRAWIEIDASDAINPALLISSPEALEALGLEADPIAFQRYENIGLYLPGICSEYVPKSIDEFNSSSFEGVEIEGPIGVNITALELAGVNLTALAEKLRNDTEVDEILARTNGSSKNLGGSFILPVLNKNQYDPFSAPIVFQGSAVVVRFGIYIESMSNFQTSTMDYDMDIYLMMSWRDARLVNPYDKPILVKEEDILEKIWRPDPFFANAKEAEFHEVTFLNFLMRIFPDGLVLYETRVKIKPSCNLILCKYPHDKQTCDLLIKSFAYPIETVRFEWFTHRKNAIDKNPDVKLPELYIDRYETTTCAHARKSGDFSCLRAVFRLKRDVGYHIAQTYIPTSLALMFSWVGVWLPEEFMEGRIGVAITVLLTLSTESAGAREHLPSVSYLKAIDLWFGFITGFVFFTLLQTLFVIGFDKRANQLRKWAGRKTSDITEEIREALLQKATRYHKTGRYLDNFCRVFYPLSFLLFLFIYYFVFTEGRQDDCMNRR